MTDKKLITPLQTGCACRWDSEGNRVETCVRHQGWLDVVSEWAERAKTAEAEVAEYRKCADDAAMAHKVERDALMLEVERLKHLLIDAEGEV